MSMKTTVSSKGQIVLPTELRELDRIELGQQFDVQRLDRGDYRLTRLAAISSPSRTKRDPSGGGGTARIIPSDSRRESDSNRHPFRFHPSAHAVDMA
jgi:bifunctional DNA-binding transcriptional regulator/antitoxin component of YhaV-PrlF toxin-antitoxin module